MGTDEGSFTRAGHHYMLLNRERPPERVQKVNADVGEGYGIVIPAIEGFEFDIHNTKARYLREVAVSLDDPKYDARTGRAGVICRGYLSNTGTFAGALDVRFAADLVFIKLPEGAAPEPVVVTGEMTDVSETSSFDITARF